MKDEIIKLNVGGKIYKTSRSLLCRYRKSLLCELVSEKLKEKNHPNGKEKEIFIDRNGNRFEYILDFLRDGILIIENDLNLLTKILIEASYFRLDPLIDILKKKIGSLLSDVDRSVNKKLIIHVIKNIEQNGKEQNDNFWNKKSGAKSNGTATTICSDLVNNTLINHNEKISSILQTNVQTIVNDFSKDISQFRKLKFSKLKKKRVHRSNIIHYTKNKLEEKEDGKHYSLVEDSVKDNNTYDKELKIYDNEPQDSSDLEKAYKTCSSDREDLYYVKISTCDNFEKNENQSNEKASTAATPQKDGPKIFLTAPSESDSSHRNSTFKNIKLHENGIQNKMYSLGPYSINPQSNRMIPTNNRPSGSNSYVENLCDDNRRIYMNTPQLNDNFRNHEVMVGNSNLMKMGNAVNGSFHYGDQQNNKTDNIMTFADTDDIEETSPFHTTTNVNLGEPVFSTTAEF